MNEIRLANTVEEIAGCLPVMRQLRPELTDDGFVGRVHLQMTQGYRLAYLMDAHGVVVGVAGFRIQDILATGKTLYVDDLVTDAAQRSRGFGKEMLHWLETHARENGCQTFSLDSGTHRQEAHAFYFRERMRVTSFHFAKKL